MLWFSGLIGALGSVGVVSIRLLTARLEMQGRCAVCWSRVCQSSRTPQRSRERDSVCTESNISRGKKTCYAKKENGNARKEEEDEGQVELDPRGTLQGGRGIFAGKGMGGCASSLSLSFIFAVEMVHM